MQCDTVRAIKFTIDPRTFRNFFIRGDGAVLGSLDNRSERVMHMSTENRSSSRRLDRRNWFRAVAASGVLANCPSSLLASRDDDPLVPITGRADAAFECIDRMMAGFIALYDIPGGAMAVTRGKRLLYARGFGYADVEKKELVKPDTLFRIASVSKPVTGVAVLRLVEKGKLALDDRAFDVLDVKPHLEKGAQVDPRLKDITVLQLLHHTGGWDRAKSFDPMFRTVEFAKALEAEPPANSEQVIRCMMGKPLDFAPGERSAYSNFGYCVLGRIIEKIAGKSYKNHVREEVLAPLRIGKMQIGKTLRDGRAPGETCYYDTFHRSGPAVVGKPTGRNVPLPYGAWALEPMDSHGGWIASVIDLAKFSIAFDEPEQCPILNEKSIRTMFARPPGLAGFNEKGQPHAAFYACGWNVRPQGETGKANTWHGGALAGSAAWLVRRFDGINFNMLFNTMESPKGEYLGNLIDFYGHHAIGKVRNWPGHDLFTVDPSKK